MSAISICERVLTVSRAVPDCSPFKEVVFLGTTTIPHPAPPSQRCGNPQRTSNGADLDAATMRDLCYFLWVAFDRPVVDETGTAGKFNFHLDLPTERSEISNAARAARPQYVIPSIISAIKTAIKKLGLNLEPTEGPGKFIVIDRVERPSGK